MSLAPHPAPHAGVTQLLVAGIGEMVISRDPKTTLVAYGLGSCVALAAWDPVTAVGGLAHFMLPTTPPSAVPPGPPAKFIDGGLPAFLERFARHGGRPGHARFKAAGGAAMLVLLSGGSSGGLEIGRRNAEALSAGLAALGLTLHARDLGGPAGRTVQLEVGTGRLLVKSLSTVTAL
jgi:chemotaxis protein CheD